MLPNKIEHLSLIQNAAMRSLWYVQRWHDWCWKQARSGGKRWANVHSQATTHLQGKRAGKGLYILRAKGRHDCRCLMHIQGDAVSWDLGQWACLGIWALRYRSTSNAMLSGWGRQLCEGVRVSCRACSGHLCNVVLHTLQSCVLSCKESLEIYPPVFERNIF
jgi:hypothetical protein